MFAEVRSYKYPSAPRVVSFAPSTHPVYTMPPKRKPDASTEQQSKRPTKDSAATKPAPEHDPRDVETAKKKLADAIAKIKETTDKAIEFYQALRDLNEGMIIESWKERLGEMCELYEKHSPSLGKIYSCLYSTDRTLEMAIARAKAERELKEKNADQDKARSALTRRMGTRLEGLLSQDATKLAGVERFIFARDVNDAKNYLDDRMVDLTEAEKTLVKRAREMIIEHKLPTYW